MNDYVFCPPGGKSDARKINVETICISCFCVHSLDSFDSSCVQYWRVQYWHVQYSCVQVDRVDNEIFIRDLFIYY